VRQKQPIARASVHEPLPFGSKRIESVQVADNLNPILGVQLFLWLREDVLLDQDSFFRRDV